jgi:hypothetical protein
MVNMMIRRCGTSLDYEREFALNNPIGTINIMKMPDLISCYRIQVKLAETQFYIEDFNRRSDGWHVANEVTRKLKEEE